MKEKCSICGSENHMDPHSWEPCMITRIMEEKHCCFSCAFWFEKLEVFKNDPNWCIIGGYSYYINPIKVKRSYFMGMGGRVFYIEKFNGEKVVSNDTWCRGEVPSHFRELIKDNAKFITKEEYYGSRSCHVLGENLEVWDLNHKKRFMIRKGQLISKVHGNIYTTSDCRKFRLSELQEVVYLKPLFKR